MEELILDIRHRLHKFPELSGNEIKSTAFIVELLRKCSPEVINTGKGGKGVWAIFDSGNPGPMVLFRAELDALPLFETTKLEHASVNKGVAHKCGHDGHAAILAGLAALVSENRPLKGKLVLLFQPAEETGMGAKSILADRAFRKLKPDFSFAMHNLPGYSSGSIIIRLGTFAAASRGMIISLKGMTSHASEPEKGHSPASVMSQLMADLPRIAGDSNLAKFSDFVLLTIVHANMGMPSFGISPADAVLMATLRAYLDEDMELMCSMAEIMVKNVSELSGLVYEIKYTEDFPATINQREPAEMVINAARTLGFELNNVVLPFRWSEDFAHFGAISKSVLFGIGAGEKQPPLHHPDYDFPDHIIPTAIDMWRTLYENLLR
ncbi:MAG: amidohydrolase [Lentimicrobium sp.]|nr:amidohydrolase [Lentimicrobium sp.]